MRVVGMDVHVRNSFLCVTESDGQVLKRGRVGNTLGELAQFFAPLEADGSPMHVVLESTTNSRAICQMLQAYGKGAGIDVKAQVLDARKLRIIAESVSKCDRQDAGVLNELARSNLKLPVCYMPDDEVFALREHLRGRADLVRMRTMLKNRAHAVLHRRGILNPHDDVFSKGGRAWLKELALDDAGRSILDRVLSLVDGFEETIKGSTASLNELARSQRWCKPAALLRTMPGVGLITSLTILAELADVKRFKSRASVSNFAGLVPRVRNSNEKAYSGNITRRGPAHLRAALVEAAWTSVSRVPQYRGIYDRVAQRSGKQPAIVAVARRMLEDAWTMLVREEVFRPRSVTAINVVTGKRSNVEPATIPGELLAANSEPAVGPSDAG
jgi:transposase